MGPMLWILLLSYYSSALARTKNNKDVSFIQQCSEIMVNKTVHSELDVITWIQAQQKQFPSTHFIGDISMEKKANWIKYQSKNLSTDSESFQYHENCASIENIRNSTVDAVIWNFGLNLLHASPALPYKIKSIKEYTNILTECIKRIDVVYPDSKKYFVLTNNICVEKLSFDVKESLEKWNSDPRLELNLLYFLQFSNIGVNIINKIALEIIGNSKHSILPSYTVDSCDCTKDGVIYEPIDPHFIAEFFNTYLII